MTTAIEPVKRCGSRWCDTDECVVEIDAAAIDAAEYVWDKLDCVDWGAAKKPTDEDDILRIAHAIVSARTPALMALHEAHRQLVLATRARVLTSEIEKALEQLAAAINELPKLSAAINGLPAGAAT